MQLTTFGVGYVRLAQGAVLADKTMMFCVSTDMKKLL
jgi:UDP-glucose 6-dehydrogenase